jgi:hypothetical protein
VLPLVRRRVDHRCGLRPQTAVSIRRLSPRLVGRKLLYGSSPSSCEPAEAGSVMFLIAGELGIEEFPPRLGRKRVWFERRPMGGLAAALQPEPPEAFGCRMEADF